MKSAVSPHKLLFFFKICPHPCRAVDGPIYLCLALFAFSQGWGASGFYLKLHVQGGNYCTFFSYSRLMFSLQVVFFLSLYPSLFSGVDNCCVYNFICVMDLDKTSWTKESLVKGQITTLESP